METYSQSENINELADALSKFQGQVMSIAKNKEVKFSTVNFRYADLTDTWNAIREPLSANGLSVLQIIMRYEDKPAMMTQVLHKSGQWIKGICTFDFLAKDMKSFGSNITYYRRYLLTSFLGIVSDDDIDNGEDIQQVKDIKPKKGEISPRFESYLKKWYPNTDKFKIWSIGQKAKYKWQSDDEMVDAFEKNAEFVKAEFNKWLIESSIPMSINTDNVKT